MSKNLNTNALFKLFLLFVLTILILIDIKPLLSAEKPAGLNDGLVNPGYAEKPAWFKDSFLDIREDITEATDEDKRLMLYFYQDGCPYCKKLLEDNFGDPAIAEMTQQNFDVIAINLWGDREVTDVVGKETTEKAFAAELKVQYTPTLLFMDEDGGVVLRVNGYYEPETFKLALDFVAGKHEKQGSISDYLAKRETAPAETTAKFALGNTLAESLPQPLKLADTLKEQGRPLLVIFEQADCAACDELHKEVLKRDAPAYSLSNLDVAQIDINASDTLQTPAGEDVSMSEWAKSLNVKFTPSLVFFDSEGTEVFRTEAYLKSFHLHGAMDYVNSGAYQRQPSFQRFLQRRMDIMSARGFEVDLLE